MILKHSTEHSSTAAYMHHHQLVISYNPLYALLEFKDLLRTKSLKLPPSRYAPSRVRFDSESKCNENNLIPFVRTDHAQFVNRHKLYTQSVLDLYKYLFP